MSYRFKSVNISKWQLALLIGTPVAIGLGFYIYKKTGRTDTKVDESKVSSNLSGRKDLDERTESKSLDSKSDGNLSDRNHRNVEQNDVKLTPLQEANKYKNEGNICYRNGKFSEAISFYDKAIATCPENNNTDLAIFYQNRAAAYEMIKKWKRVKEDCCRSLEYNPRYAKAYFRRAKAFEATNNIFECLEDVTATCILEMFQNNNTIMYADRILKRTGREDAERGIKDRVPVLPSKNFISTYLRSFVTDPVRSLKLPASLNTTTPHGIVRAKLALEKENYEEVIPACTEEIESTESEAQYKSEALLLRGTFYLLSGSFDEGLQDFNALIENADADLTLRTYARIKRASLYIQLENKELGLEDFDAAEQLQPENPDTYHQRAQIFILLDQLNDALSEFNKAVSLAPEHAMAFVQKCYADYRLALMSQDQMRLMMVMADFKNAIDKFPECVECYSLMAQVLSDQQQYPEADQFYEKAISKAPQNASLYVHRGIMLLQWKGDVDSAIELMNRALEVDDKCELAYETLGTIEVQRANLDRAVELFEKAVKLAKSQLEMCHLYALRNAAVAQINVTHKLGIDMSTISALAKSQSEMPVF